MAALVDVIPHNGHSAVDHRLCLSLSRPPARRINSYSVRYLLHPRPLKLQSRHPLELLNKWPKAAGVCVSTYEALDRFTHQIRASIYREARRLVPTYLTTFVPLHTPDRRTARQVARDGISTTHARLLELAPQLPSHHPADLSRLSHL